MRVEGARLEVLGDDVEARREAQHEVAPGGRLEVDADAALAQVVAQERRADAPPLRIRHRRERSPTRLPVNRVLDLHDVGAEAREQLRGERQRLHLLEREHAHAFQWLAVRHRLSVRDVAEPHGRSSYAPDLTVRQISTYHPPDARDPGGRRLRTSASPRPQRDPRRLRERRRKGHARRRLLRRGHDDARGRGGAPRVPQRRRRSCGAVVRDRGPDLPREDQRMPRSTPPCASIARSPRSTSAAPSAPALGAVLNALRSTVPTLVVVADRRGGLPTSADESAGGDGAAALLLGDAPTDRVLAELLGDRFGDPRGDRPLANARGPADEAMGGTPRRGRLPRPRPRTPGRLR